MVKGPGLYSRGNNLLFFSLLSGWLLSCHLDEWLIRQSVKRIMIWLGHSDGAGGGVGVGGSKHLRQQDDVGGAYSRLAQYWAGGEHPPHCQDSFSQN